VRLILVRHGETIWNDERRYQGEADLPLSESGEIQARQVAVRLADEAIDLIYSSDLKRALQTADRVAAVHGTKIIVERRLRELSFGAWEGLTYAEIQERYPQALARWEEEPLVTAPPGGESLNGLVGRVKDFCDDLKRLEEETVLLVSHGGPLRELICLALGLAPTDYWRLRLDPGSVSELYLYPESAILALLNDRHHLLEVGGGG